MNRLFVTFQRLFKVGLLSESFTFIEMSRERLGIQLQRAIESGKGLIRLLSPNIEDREIDEALCKIRRECGDLLQHLLAFDEISLIEIDRRNVRISRINVRFQRK